MNRNYIGKVAFANFIDLDVAKRNMSEFTDQIKSDVNTIKTNFDLPNRMKEGYKKLRDRLPWRDKGSTMNQTEEKIEKKANNMVMPRQDFNPPEDPLKTMLNEDRKKALSDGFNQAYGYIKRKIRPNQGEQAPQRSIDPNTKLISPAPQYLNKQASAIAELSRRIALIKLASDEVADEAADAAEPGFNYAGAAKGAATGAAIGMGTRLLVPSISKGGLASYGYKAGDKIIQKGGQIVKPGGLFRKTVRAAATPGTLAHGVGSFMKRNPRLGALLAASVSVPAIAGGIIGTRVGGKREN